MHSAAGPGGAPLGSPLQTSMGSARATTDYLSLTGTVGGSAAKAAGCRQRGAGLWGTLPLAFTLLVRPLPPGPAHLPRSARGGLSPLPAAPGWRLGEAVALAPGTEGLSPLCLVLCCALCLWGSEHPCCCHISKGEFHEGWPPASLPSYPLPWGTGAQASTSGLGRVPATS